MLVDVKDLDFAYGINEIFSGANFRIDKGEKVGLVGRNGSGKSTFLKLLSDELEMDGGTIQIASDITVGYLEQQPSFDDSKTLDELFLSVFEETIRKEKRLRELERLITDEEGDVEAHLEEYGQLQDFFLQGESHDYKSQIRGLVKGLGLSEKELKTPYGKFSGGEKTRINLAMLLLRKPDLLLLDEPTNFLDIKTLNWLENSLNDYPGSFLVISHDRFFLDKVCSRIDEVSNKKITSYPGNYSDYVKTRKKIVAKKNKYYANVLKKVKREQDIIRRYRDFNSKQSSKHARSREKALSKIEIPEEIKVEGDIHFDFSPRIRSGDEVLKVSELSKHFEDKPLFDNLNFNVMRGDKIGIIGENGIGKTTLFEILRGRVIKNGGRIIFGSKVHPGWYDQESKDLRELNDFTLIEALRESDKTLSDGEARNILASFLFREDDVFKKISDLSGGERARIKLAQLMLEETNFLLLDEPTNHIDLNTKEILGATRFLVKSQKLLKLEQLKLKKAKKKQSA